MTGSYNELEFQGQYTIIYIPKKRNYSVTFLVESDKVVLMELSLYSDTSLAPTLAEVVQAMGEPCCTLLAYSYDTQRAGGSIMLYYPEKGFFFHIPLASATVHTNTNSMEICVQETNKVFLAKLMQPSTLETQILDNNFLGNPNTPPEKIEHILSFIKPWPGYGCFEVPYSADKVSSRASPVMNYR